MLFGQGAQGYTTDELLYYFLRMRKSRVRDRVARIRREHPLETAEQHARRLTASTARLAAFAGGVTSVPLLFPRTGAVIKAVGIAGGASVLSRMNLHLILEIAMLYGKDIDSNERVSEMALVLGGTAASVVAPALFAAQQAAPPVLEFLLGPAAAAGMSWWIGSQAIAHYAKSAGEVVAPISTDTSIA